MAYKTNLIWQVNIQGIPDSDYAHKHVYMACLLLSVCIVYIWGLANFIDFVMP